VTNYSNDVTKIKWPQQLGDLMFLSTGIYGDKILIGNFSIKKEDIKLQPTCMVITHYNKQGQTLFR